MQQFLDTHSLHYENIFIHIRVLFTKTFRRTKRKVEVNTRSSEVKLIMKHFQPIGDGVNGAKEVECEKKRETSSALALVQFANDVEHAGNFVMKASHQIKTLFVAAQISIMAQ